MGKEDDKSQERRSTLRVLVVDDTPDIRLLLEMTLVQDPGCSLVGVAVDGRQAIEKVGALGPDLVVMDQHMPVMTGEEATAEIRSRWPQVDVVGFTSHPEGESLMLGAGAVVNFVKSDFAHLRDYLSKRGQERQSG